MTTKSSKRGNSVATPLVRDAYKLHRLIFQYAYPYPIHIKFEKQTISLTKDKVLQFKYIPFLIALIVVTTFIGFGTCIFLPFYKLFKKSSNIDVVAVVICVFLGSCSFFEWSTYLICGLSTELEPLINQIFEVERNYYKLERRKRVDFLGLILMTAHLMLLCLAPVFPFIAIFWDLDPFYHLFELILPSAYERSITLILMIPLIRLFSGIICAFEFCRFLSIETFVFMTTSLTVLTCVRQLFEERLKSEWRTLQLYTHLRILLIIADGVVHVFVFFVLTFLQVFMTTLWWIVFKCSDIFPVLITISAFLGAILATFCAIFLIPKGVEVCRSSQMFIVNKTAMNHTFKKDSATKYFYLRWKSQRLLPIRCGSHFTLSKSTPMEYLNVFLTNLTNAVLLINP